MKKFFTVERYIFNEEKEDYEVVETKNIKIKWSSRFKCWLHNFIVFFPGLLMCLAVIFVAPAVIFQSIVWGLIIIGLIAKGLILFYLWCGWDLTCCDYIEYQQEDFADWAQLNAEEEKKYDKYFQMKREERENAQKSLVGKLSGKISDDIKDGLSEKEKDILEQWLKNEIEK